MTDDLIWHASGFEILFLASALVGSRLARRNFIEALNDSRFLAAQGISNGRRMETIGRMWTELILGSIHALYIIAGLVAASTPSRGDATITTVLLSAVIVFASWGMTTISFLSRRTGKYLAAHGLQNRDSQGRFIKATNGTGRDLEEPPE